jgi:hypothetical protein
MDEVVLASLVGCSEREPVPSNPDSEGAERLQSGGVEGEHPPARGLRLLDVSRVRIERYPRLCDGDRFGVDVASARPIPWSGVSLQA